MKYAMGILRFPRKISHYVCLFTKVSSIMSFPSDSGSYAQWSDLGSRQVDIPDLALNTNMTPPCRDLAGEYPDVAAGTELNYAPASTLPMTDMQNSVISARDPVVGVEISSEASQRNTRRKKYADENDWEFHREKISELYKVMKLKDVLEIMEQTYNFFATEKMYKDRFKKWGVEKNVTAKRVRGWLDAQSGNIWHGQQQPSSREYSSPPPGPAITSACNATDISRVQKYIRRRPAGLSKLSIEDQRRAIDLSVADKGKRAHGNARRSSRYHPAARQSDRHMAYFEDSPHHTHLSKGPVSDTQDGQQHIHGFFADQTSAYQLMASMPFDNHQGPLYPGTVQPDIRERLFSGYSSVYQSDPSSVRSNSFGAEQLWTQLQSSAYAGTPTTSWTGTSFVQRPEEPPTLDQQLNQYG
jgi:hypothetical protein